MSSAKIRISIISIFAFAVLATSYFARPVASVSGEVEKQIHALGPQLSPALAPASNFTRTPNGYQPNPEPPQAPAGLKPVELQAWTAMAQRNSGEPALVPTFTVQDTQAISASSNRYMRLVISP